MNGFSADPGERRARVMSIQPPGRSSPPEPTAARTALPLVSITRIAATASVPWAFAVLAASGSSRRCRSASIVVTIDAWSNGAACASCPAACQARAGNTPRAGKASASASRACSSSIKPDRRILASTWARAARAAVVLRSGRRASGDCGNAISSACSPSVRVCGSCPK